MMRFRRSNRAGLPKSGEPVQLEGLAAGLCTLGDEDYGTPPLLAVSLGVLIIRKKCHLRKHMG